MSCDTTRQALDFVHGLKGGEIGTVAHVALDAVYTTAYQPHALSKKYYDGWHRFNMYKALRSAGGIRPLR